MTSETEQVDPEARFCQQAIAFRDWRGTGAFKISGQVIAKVARVSPPTAYGWINGNSCPNVFQLRQLEEYRSGLVARLFPRDALLAVTRADLDRVTA